MARQVDLLGEAMTKFTVSLALRVSGDLDALEDDLDRTLEEIEKLGGVEDVDYTATLADATVEFTGFVEAASLTEAQQLFLAAVRTGIHAAEGSTPGWPSFSDLAAETRLVERDGADLIDA